MAGLRELALRAVGASLGALALLGGFALGSTGCVICNCDRVDVAPVELGTYEIVESLERPELVGGMVEIEAERVELSITDAQDGDWVIDYAVAG